MMTRVTPVSGRQVVKVIRALERRGDVAEFAAKENAVTVKDQQAEIGKAARFVAHFLGEYNPHPECDDCIAAREWLDS